MSGAVEGKPTESPLVLDAVLDIRAAGGLHRDLLERRGSALRIDAGQVERIGGQCAAILLSAARSWAADGHIFALDDPTQGLCEGLELLGLDIRDVGGTQARP